MSDRAQQYADWLVANQSKKGTPEFQTVADAYTQLRQGQQPQQQQAQQPQQPAAAQNNDIVDTATNLGKGMYDRVLAMGSGAADLIPTVSKALTGEEIELIDLEGASDFLDKKREELNYTPLVPWEDVKANPSAANVLGFMGEAAVTSLPDMAAAMISAPAYFLTYIAPIANERAENDGRSEPTPSDLAFASVAAAGIATAEKVGAKGIFGQQAGNVIQRTANAGVKEAATESIQNPLEYAGETVGTETGFDTATALDQAAAGTVGGFGAGTSIRATTEALTAGGRTEPEDPQAASDLANRLTVLEKANQFKPGNVSQSMDVKGARAMLDQAHTQIAEEIKQQKKFAKDRLKPDASDSDTDIKLKSLAEAGFRQAGNKTKNTVGQQEYNAVESLLGDTAEGQRILKLFRESNELTTLHNQGLKGGLSKYTDVVNPFNFGAGYSSKPLIEVPTRLGITGALASQTGGASLAAQLGIAATGRAIDKFTGSRSNVASYMRQNAGQGGVREIQSPALRKARQKDQYKKREFNAEQEKDAYEQNLPIGRNNKPASMVNQDTGLNRREQVELAERMLLMNEYKVIHEQLKQLIKSVKGEYQQVQNINGVIERMMGELQKTQQQTSTEASTPQISQLPNAARQQGILDNQNRLESLRKRAMADNQLNAADRDLINDTFDQLKLDLGSNPVEAAESIIQGANALALNKAAINRYLNPYLERVRQQQKGKKPEASQGAVTEETNADLIPTSGDIIREETNADLFDPVDFNEYEDTTYYHGTASIFKEFDAAARGKETDASSAKQAFWFSDDTETAMSYANYAAYFGVPSRMERDAAAKEYDAQVAQQYGEADRAKRLFDEADNIRREAEEYENRLSKDADARKANQNIIPVYVPKNLMVVDIEGETYYSGKISEHLKKAKAQGYDGVKFLNLDDAVGLIDKPATHIAIFDPSKIRSKFAPQQNTNKDAPLLKIKNQEEFESMAKHVRGRQLRDGLDAMLQKAGEGMLKKYKKGDPIGKLGENFDNTKMLSKELVKYLDPEGRETVSRVQVGMDGKGLSEEDVKVIMPHLVRGLRFITGSDAMDSGFLGAFRTVKLPNGKVSKRMIDMVDIGEKLNRSPDAPTMTGEMFLDTLYHEIGHSLESQTALRSMVDVTAAFVRSGDPDSAQDLQDLIEVSRQRRKANWEQLENHRNYIFDISGKYPPSYAETAAWDFTDWIRFSHDAQESLSNQGMIQDIERFQNIWKRYQERVQYMTNPAELSADLIAYYFAKPEALKAKYPKLAKMVRKAVNESDLSQYISFHTITGLLGAGAIQSLLMGMDDEEDKGILSPGTGALSNAA